ncbi:hypothetical protein [Micromonospora coerulea]|uniref:hypothetical protein n=1 Tax=Micromonospora coerulea TaxID=47856 RepID=UPI001902C31A|nr:hypothetical protein [Micromonospora veneta]
MEGKSFRYRLDRRAQGFGMLRAADAFGLRHPNVNRASYLLLAVFFGALTGWLARSVLVGVVSGVVVGLAVFFLTRANHRRRVANGTSAQFGPPRD